MDLGTSRWDASAEAREAQTLDDATDVGNAIARMQRRWRAGWRSSVGSMAAMVAEQRDRRPARQTTRARRDAMRTDERSAAAPQTIPTLDGVAELITRAIAAEVAEGRRRCAAIIDAANGYAAAVERAAVGRFMHRNGMLDAAPDDHQRAAYALYELVERMPELGGQRPPGPAEATADAADVAADVASDDDAPADVASANDAPEAAATAPDDARAWPLARALVARVGPVAMVGGIPQIDRVRWGEKTLGAFEWVACYRDRDGGTERLWGRARRGRVAAVLICEELVLHAVSDAAMAACRAGGVPFYYVGKGGVAKVRTALDALERFAAQAEAASAAG